MARSDISQQSPLVPFDWVITPAGGGPAKICPGPSLILGTFAAINAAAGLASLVLGSRRVIRMLTCGMLGKPDSKAWGYMWIVNLALQLGANVVVALLIKSTPGYLSTFSVGELVLFFTTRPRLGWMFLSLAQFLSNPTVFGTPKQSTWWSSALSCSLAEVLQQIIAMYFMGRTAAFAAPRGYYKVWTQEYAILPSGAHLM